MTRPDSYFPVTISDGVRCAARRTPDKIAMGESGRMLTYAKLVDRVDQVANAVFAGLKLGMGDHSAIFMPNRLEFIEIVLGLSSAGVPPAVVPQNATGPELANICDDSEAKVLFVHQDLEDVARSVDLQTVETIIVVGKDYEDWRDRARTGAPNIAHEEWDVFIISYTSGTTGKPKGCLLPHRSRVMGFYTMAAEYGCYSPEDRGLAATPLDSGAGLAFAISPMFFGGYTEIMPKFDAEAALRHLSENGITSSFFVPTQFTAMLSLEEKTRERFRRHSLKAIITGGAPLAEETKEDILDYFGDGVFHELYGSNEAGYHTNLRPSDQRRKKRCVGLPYPLVDLRLLDDDGREVGPGEQGEVYIRSPMLFSEYWRRPEATAEAFRDGYVTVGDVGRFDDERYLYLVDRKKEVIITGGANVYPREVEDVLHAHPDIAEAAVFGIEDDYWGEAVTAAIVPRGGAAPTPEGLKSHCGKSLAGQKIPKSFILVDSLPRNPTGKILKRLLKEGVEKGTLTNR